MREAMVHRSTEANPGRCRARTSNPACGTLYRGWVRHPLASAKLTHLFSKYYTVLILLGAQYWRFCTGVK